MTSVVKYQLKLSTEVPKSRHCNIA